MVIFHMGDFNGEASNVLDAYINGGLNHIFVTMGYVVMSHFFSITGFLLMYGFTLRDYKDKIQRRFFSLFIPYTVWQLIFSIPLFMEGNLSLGDFVVKNYMLVAFPVDGHYGMYMQYSYWHF